MEIHYTPRHGNRLDIAEIELSALGRQCIANNYCTQADEWGGEQLFYFVMRFECADSGTDAGRKTWRVAGFDFDA